MGRVKDTEGKRGALVDEFSGVTLRANVDGSDGQSPKDANAAPRGGHGIDAPFGSGGDSHPVLPDKGKGIVGKFRWGNFTKLSHGNTPFIENKERRPRHQAA